MKRKDPSTGSEAPGPGTPKDCLWGLSHRQFIRYTEGFATVWGVSPELQSCPKYLKSRLKRIKLSLTNLTASQNKLMNINRSTKIFSTQPSKIYSVWNTAKKKKKVTVMQRSRKI